MPLSTIQVFEATFLYVAFPAVDKSCSGVQGNLFFFLTHLLTRQPLCTDRRPTADLAARHAGPRDPELQQVTASRMSECMPDRMPEINRTIIYYNHNPSQSHPVELLKLK